MGVETRLGAELEVSQNEDGDAIIVDPILSLPEDERKAKREDMCQDFLNSLPEDHLAPEETCLRDALFSFLTSWNKPGSPTLGLAGGDPAVSKARHRCLPKGVPFSEWINHRIGGEVELKPSPNGQFAMRWT